MEAAPNKKGTTAFSMNIRIDIHSTPSFYLRDSALNKRIAPSVLLRGSPEFHSVSSPVMMTPESFTPSAARPACAGSCVFLETSTSILNLLQNNSITQCESQRGHLIWLFPANAPPNSVSFPDPLPFPRSVMYNLCITVYNP